MVFFVVVEGFAPLVERMLCMCVKEKERKRRPQHGRHLHNNNGNSVYVCVEKRETMKRVKINTALTGCRDRGISVRCKR